MTKFSKVVVNQLRKFSRGQIEFDRDDDPSIATLVNLPHENVLTLSTIGISNFAALSTGSLSHVHVELLSACYSTEDVSLLKEALLNLRERSIANRLGFLHGTLISNAFSSRFAGFLLTSPFSWDFQFSAVQMDGEHLAWLQAVPLKASEIKVYDARGFDYLENLLADSDIDIFDLKRESIV